MDVPPLTLWRSTSGSGLSGRSVRSHEVVRLTLIRDQPAVFGQSLEHIPHTDSVKIPRKALFSTE
jgi:hypothetical protein